MVQQANYFYQNYLINVYNSYIKNYLKYKSNIDIEISRNNTQLNLRENEKIDEYKSNDEKFDKKCIDKQLENSVVPKTNKKLIIEIEEKLDKKEKDKESNVDNTNKFFSKCVIY